MHFKSTLTSLTVLFVLLTTSGVFQEASAKRGRDRDRNGRVDRSDRGRDRGRHVGRANRDHRNRNIDRDRRRNQRRDRVRDRRAGHRGDDIDRRNHRRGNHARRDDRDQRRGDRYRRDRDRRDRDRDRIRHRRDRDRHDRIRHRRDRDRDRARARARRRARRHSDYRHRPYRRHRDYRVRWSKPRQYHRSLRSRSIYLNRWVRLSLNLGFHDGYHYHDNYPYYVYNGYAHRYGHRDICHYELVDSYDNRVEERFYGYSCNIGYDLCADLRDDLNSWDYRERYFCAERYDY